MLGVAAAVAVAVALMASVGSLVGGAERTMTARSVNQVAVDWQVETQPNSDPSAVLDQISHSPAVATAVPVEFADTTGLTAHAGDSEQATGSGVIVGMPSNYAQVFPGSIRLIAGAAEGVLLPQQAAASLHAAPGSIVHIP